MPGRVGKAGASRASPEDDDTSMDDAPTSAQQPVEEHDDDDAMEKDPSEDPFEEEKEPQRVRILPGSSETAASFEFLKEGHTLGNALRPDVEFCAYAIPHPSEDKMNLRIQTYDTTTAAAALAKGLQDLEDLCDVVADEFWTKREEFNATKS
ncbi:DNA-directed RNA polymerase [Hypoxylon cercidicola]|nr:DNA-directed RNA polymerase [Hypoxylon cercidicola]